MKCNLCGPACLSAVGLLAVAGMFAMGQPAKDSKPAAPAHPAAPAGQPEMKLPPGWTAEDMQACMAAGMPGEQHKELAKGVGTWSGKNTMWMAPGAEPTTSNCTSTVTMIMDGRYNKCEMKGEIPGMGEFHGEGIVGYDNVSHKYVGTWYDSMSTGIMNGTGERSKDGKVMTWSYKFNCPLTKKEATMRQVETLTGANTMKLEMYMADPKTGKEYKNMVIELTRK